MALWKEPAGTKPAQTPAAAEPAKLPPDPVTPASLSPAPTPITAATPARTREVKESLIAADLTIEGKIEGAGHIRIAGRFKGDVNVQGDLTIETGAKLNGGVRAKKVIIAGELEGNIESASRVELLSSGVLIGDVKAGALTVAAGSRMRGQADFGWDEPATGKSSGKSGNATEPGAAT